MLNGKQGIDDVGDLCQIETESAGTGEIPLALDRALHQRGIDRNGIDLGGNLGMLPYDQPHAITKRADDVSVKDIENFLEALRVVDRVKEQTDLAAGIARTIDRMLQHRQQMDEASACRIGDALDGEAPTAVVDVTAGDLGRRSAVVLCAQLIGVVFPMR